jgi:hypothetical protein
MDCKRPTFKMLRAIRAIANERGDIKYMSAFSTKDLSFEEVSNYIATYGRKIRI